MSGANSLEIVESRISEWRQQYGEVYLTEFEGEEGAIFIWRPLLEAEFYEIANAPYSAEIKEEAICMACILYPVDFDFNKHCLAGYATTLANQIAEASYYDSAQRALELLTTYRSQVLTDFGSQLDCIVAEAFPQYPVEAVRQMPLKRRLWLLSRAEWVLTNLRGVPLTHQISDQPVRSGTVPPQSSGVAPHASNVVDPTVAQIHESVDNMFRDETYRGSDPDWIFDDPGEDVVLG